MLDVIRSINWIDLVVLAIFVRIIYTAFNTGFVLELFKFFAQVIALFVAFHYYVFLAEFLKQERIPQGFIQLVVFVLLWVAAVVIIKFIRDGILSIFTVQTQSAVDKWGGAVLGVLRAITVASMVMFSLLIPAQKYFEAKVFGAFSHKYLLEIAPGAYQKICGGFVTRLFPSEHYNQTVREVLSQKAK